MFPDKESRLNAVATMMMREQLRHIRFLYIVIVGLVVLYAATVASFVYCLEKNISADSNLFFNVAAPPIATIASRINNQARPARRTDTFA